MALTLLSYVHHQHLATSTSTTSTTTTTSSAISPSYSSWLGLAGPPDSNSASHQPRIIYRHIISWVERGGGPETDFKSYVSSGIQLFTLEIERIIDEEVFP